MRKHARALMAPFALAAGLALACPAAALDLTGTWTPKGGVVKCAFIDGSGRQGTIKPAFPDALIQQDSSGGLFGLVGPYVEGLAIGFARSPAKGRAILNGCFGVVPEIYVSSATTFAERKGVSGRLSASFQYVRPAKAAVAAVAAVGPINLVLPVIFDCKGTFERTSSLPPDKLQGLDCASAQQ